MDQVRRVLLQRHRAMSRHPHVLPCNDVWLQHRRAVGVKCDECHATRRRNDADNQQDLSRSIIPFAPGICHVDRVIVVARVFHPRDDLILGPESSIKLCRYRRDSPHEYFIMDISLASMLHDRFRKLARVDALRLMVYPSMRRIPQLLKH